MNSFNDSDKTLIFFLVFKELCNEDYGMLRRTSKFFNGIPTPFEDRKRATETQVTTCGWVDTPSSIKTLYKGNIIKIERFYHTGHKKSVKNYCYITGNFKGVQEDYYFNGALRILHDCEENIKMFWNADGTFDRIYYEYNEVAHRLQF